MQLNLIREFPTCTSIPEVFQILHTEQLFYNHFNHKFRETNARIVAAGLRDHWERDFEFMRDFKFTQDRSFMELWSDDFSRPDATRAEYLDFSLRFRLFIEVFLGCGLAICTFVFAQEMLSLIPSMVGDFRRIKHQVSLLRKRVRLVLGNFVHWVRAEA